ncbi:MAG: hypothetical protein ACR2QO_23170 [Acidimicrobiales bacterium]
MAHAQLHLIYLDDEMWKLDQRTIRVGRKGLAEARAALAASARPYEDDSASVHRTAA